MGTDADAAVCGRYDDAREDEDDARDSRDGGASVDAARRASASGGCIAYGSTLESFSIP